MTEAEVSILINGCFGGFGISREGIRWLYDNHRQLAMFDGVDDIDKWSYYDHMDELRVCPELIRAIEEGVDDINFSDDHADLKVTTMPRVYYENDFYEIDEYGGAERLILNINAHELLVRQELYNLAAAAAVKKAEEETTVISCLQHILYGDHDQDMDALEVLRLLVPPSADCTMSKLAQNVQYLPGFGMAFKEGEDEFNQMKHG